MSGHSVALIHWRAMKSRLAALAAQMNRIEEFDREPVSPSRFQGIRQFAGPFAGASRFAVAVVGLCSCRPYTGISVESMSSTTCCGESTASVVAINSRLIAASPATFSSWVSKSISNDCSREVGAAPLSQIFSEPISRKVGSWESRSAPLTSTWPAIRL